MEALTKYWVGKKVAWVFHKTAWKNPNERFGQPNTLLFSLGHSRPFLWPHGL